MKDGAHVTVVEARDRVGGRVLTIRDVFARGQHAEAGGDFIDRGQEDIRRLADQYGLTVRTILRQGFSFVRYKGKGQIHGRPIEGRAGLETDRRPRQASDRSLSAGGAALGERRRQGHGPAISRSMAR